MIDTRRMHTVKTFLAYTHVHTYTPLAPPCTPHTPTHTHAPFTHIFGILYIHTPLPYTYRRTHTPFTRLLHLVHIHTEIIHRTPTLRHFCTCILFNQINN